MFGQTNRPMTKGSANDPADLSLPSALAHKQHLESPYTAQKHRASAISTPRAHSDNAHDAAMSRTTSQASTTTTNNPSNGISRERSQSVKTNAKPQSSASALSSDVKLFVTNLRLLDLDLRNDWPEITVQTFSAKNADQRQRIGGTEWALFRLFEIWDPDETAQVRCDESAGELGLSVRRNSDHSFRLSSLSNR
jgi:hypothetical protein